MLITTKINYNIILFIEENNNNIMFYQTLFVLITFLIRYNEKQINN